MKKIAKNLQPNEEFQQPICKTKVNICPFYFYDISWKELKQTK
jgi:hypothetical protein